MKRLLGRKYEEGRWLLHLSRSLITGCSGFETGYNQYFFVLPSPIGPKPKPQCRINAAE